MRRLAVPLAALILLAVPAGAAADATLSFDVPDDTVKVVGDANALDLEITRSGVGLDYDLASGRPAADSRAAGRRR